MKTTVENSSISEQLNPQPANAPFSKVTYFQSPTSPYMKTPSMEQLIMKALLKNIPVFLMTVALIFLVSCSSEPERQSAGEYIDDTVITTRVKSAILAEDSLKVSEINVETYKGVVQLSGFVSSRDDRNTAVKVAKKVKGVDSVKDDMRIK
jgi:hyperosmotically inducible protein